MDNSVPRSIGDLLSLALTFRAGIVTLFLMGKKKSSNRRRRRHVLRTLLLLYVFASLGYYFLPWETRIPIYNAAPQTDRHLKKTGQTLLCIWDELGIGGRDCSVPTNDHGKKQQVCGGFPDDYTHSGYDRGHLAPNFGIATRYGRDGQKETFLMTNIMPQNPTINRHPWKDLEHRVARQYGRYFEEVWVITGPIFTAPIERLPSGMAIPNAYYKIIADIHEKKLRVLAFLVDKDTRPTLGFEAI